jgi:hypothetical protein
MNTVKGPTGHALVMLQPGGKSSIVLVQGANVSWPRLADGINRLTTTVQQLIRRAGAVLLQREVPDSVNMEAAKVQNLGLQFLIRKNLSSFFCCCMFLFLSFCCQEAQPQSKAVCFDQRMHHTCNFMIHFTK